MAGPAGYVLPDLLAPEAVCWEGRVATLGQLSPEVAGWLHDLQYDPAKDFDLLTVAVRAPNVLVANPNFPAKSLQELVAYMKKNPGKVSFASSGAGSSDHLTAALFWQKSGTEGLHVPYKGGAPGFVRVLDETTLAFPNYDGNGMYLSMGNARSNPQVGLLFIDFERPHRLRVQGRASVSADDPLIDEWPGADLLVRVAVEDLWQNCPRYIHRYRRVAASPYVPVAGAEAPLAGWKRIDGMQDVLSDADQRRAEDEGVISEQAWIDQIRRGDPRA